MAMIKHTSPKRTIMPLSGKIAFTPASFIKTSRKPERPQCMGENIPIIRNVSDIMKVGIQIPPMAAIITMDMAPNTAD